MKALKTRNENHIVEVIYPNNLGCVFMYISDEGNIIRPTDIDEWLWAKENWGREVQEIEIPAQIQGLFSISAKLGVAVHKIKCIHNPVKMFNDLRSRTNQQDDDGSCPAIKYYDGNDVYKITHFYKNGQLNAFSPSKIGEMCFDLEKQGESYFESLKSIIKNSGYPEILIAWETGTGCIAYMLPPETEYINYCEKKFMSANEMMARINKLNAKIQVIENKITDKNTAILLEEIANLRWGVGLHEVEKELPHHAPLYRSSIKGVKGIKFYYIDDDKIKVETFSSEGILLPEKICVDGKEYEIVIVTPFESEPEKEIPKSSEDETEDLDISEMKKEVKILEENIFQIEKEMQEENTAQLTEEINNLFDGVGDGYVEGDYYASDRYYSDIHGVKNIRLMSGGLGLPGFIEVKITSPKGYMIPNTIKIGDDEYEVAITKSKNYKHEVDY